MRCSPRRKGARRRTDKASYNSTEEQGPRSAGTAPTAMPYHDGVAARGDAGFAEPDSLSPWLRFRFKSS